MAVQGSSNPAPSRLLSEGEFYAKNLNTLKGRGDYEKSLPDEIDTGTELITSGFSSYDEYCIWYRQHCASPSFTSASVERFSARTPERNMNGIRGAPPLSATGKSLDGVKNFLSSNLQAGIDKISWDFLGSVQIKGTKISGMSYEMLTAFIGGIIQGGIAGAYKAIETLIDNFANPLRDPKEQVGEVVDTCNQFFKEQFGNVYYSQNSEWPNFKAKGITLNQVDAFVESLFASNEATAFLDNLSSAPIFSQLQTQTRALVANMNQQMRVVADVHNLQEAYPLLMSLVSVNGVPNNQSFALLCKQMGVTPEQIEAASPKIVIEDVGFAEEFGTQTYEREVWPERPSNISADAWAIATELAKGKRDYENDLNFDAKINLLKMPLALGIGLALGAIHPILGIAVGATIAGVGSYENYSVARAALETGLSYRATNLHLASDEQVALLNENFNSSIRSGVVGVASAFFIPIGMGGYAIAGGVGALTGWAQWMSDSGQSNAAHIERVEKFRFYNAETKQYDNLTPEEAAKIHAGAQMQVWTSLACDVALGVVMGVTGEAVGKNLIPVKGTLEISLTEPGKGTLHFADGTQIPVTLKPGKTPQEIVVHLPDGRTTTANTKGAEPVAVVKNVRVPAASVNAARKAAAVAKPKPAPATKTTPAAKTLPEPASAQTETKVTAEDPQAATPTAATGNTAHPEIPFTTQSWSEAGIDETVARSMLEQTRATGGQEHIRVRNESGGEETVAGDSNTADTKTPLVLNEDSAVANARMYQNMHTHNGPPVPSGHFESDAKSPGDLWKLLGRARDAKGNQVSEKVLGIVGNEDAFIKISARRNADGRYTVEEVVGSENITPEMKAETLRRIRETEAEYNAAPEDVKAQAADADVGMQPTPVPKADTDITLGKKYPLDPVDKIKIDRLKNDAPGITVGRDDGQPVDIVLPCEGHTLISRNHLTIAKNSQGKLTVTDTSAGGLVIIKASGEKIYSGHLGKAIYKMPCVEPGTPIEVGFGDRVLLPDKSSFEIPPVVGERVYVKKGDGTIGKNWVTYNGVSHATGNTEIKTDSFTRYAVNYPDTLVPASQVEKERFSGKDVFYGNPRQRYSVWDIDSKSDTPLQIILKKDLGATIRDDDIQSVRVEDVTLAPEETAPPLSSQSAPPAYDSAPTVMAGKPPPRAREAAPPPAAAPAIARPTPHAVGSLPRGPTTPTQAASAAPPGAPPEPPSNHARWLDPREMAEERARLLDDEQGPIIRRPSLHDLVQAAIDHPDRSPPIEADEPSVRLKPGQLRPPSEPPPVANFLEHSEVCDVAGLASNKEIKFGREPAQGIKIKDAGGSVSKEQGAIGKNRDGSYYVRDLPNASNKSTSVKSPNGQQRPKAADGKISVRFGDRIFLPGKPPQVLTFNVPYQGEKVYLSKPDGGFDGPLYATQINRDGTITVSDNIRGNANDRTVNASDVVPEAVWKQAQPMNDEPTRRPGVANTLMLDHFGEEGEPVQVWQREPKPAPAPASAPPEPVQSKMPPPQNDQVRYDQVRQKPKEIRTPTPPPKTPSSLEITPRMALGLVAAAGGSAVLALGAVGATVLIDHNAEQNEATQPAKKPIDMTARLKQNDEVYVVSSDGTTKKGWKIVSVDPNSIPPSVALDNAEGEPLDIKPTVPASKVMLVTEMESPKPLAELPFDQVLVDFKTNRDKQIASCISSNDEYLELFKPGEPLKQANVGDCFLIAAFNALRHVNNFDLLMRQSIQVITTADGNSTYNVGLPLGPKTSTTEYFLIEPKDLKPQKHSDDGYGNNFAPVDGPRGYKILEAAYIKKVNKYKLDRKAVNKGGFSDEALKAMLGSNMIAQSVSLYVGSGKKLSDTPATRDEVFNYLLHYQKDKDVLATGTIHKKGYMFSINSTPGSPKLVYSHAYTIDSVILNPDKTGISLIMLANPWDTTNPIPLTFEQFEKYCDRLDGVRLK